MKKTLVLLSLVLLVSSSLFITGCKKGEDDPFISLRSRDARITAKWKLTKVEGTSTNTFGGVTYTSTESYNGTVYTTTSSSGGVNSYSYALEMEILKGGEMTSSETQDGEVSSGTGNWFWANTTSDKTGIFLGGLDDDAYFNVQGLSSNELILSLNSEYTSTSGGQTSSNQSSTTWTFEKAD